jgi:hypothetical protein
MRVRYLQQTICLAAGILGLSACATATNGSHENFRVITEPAGAQAVSDIVAPRSDEFGGFIGCAPTPCSMNLPRRSSATITVSNDGHQPIKFRVASGVATSATSVPTGTLIAGLPPGSHVLAGETDLIKRIPTGSRVVTGGLLTLGVASAVDVAVGANLNLSPNPVSVYLAPIPGTETKPPSEVQGP